MAVDTRPSIADLARSPHHRVTTHGERSAWHGRHGRRFVPDEDARNALLPGALGIGAEPMNGREDLRAWVPYRKPTPGAALRLLCYPYAGGSASLFGRWARKLPAGVELWALQPPGRETRLAEPAPHRMSELVSRLACAVEPHLDVPFAVFGHSLGALVCYELLQELRRRGA